MSRDTLTERVNARLEPKEAEACQAAFERWARARRASGVSVKFSDWVRAALRFAAKEMR